MSLLDAFKRKEPGDVPDVSDMLKSGMSEQDVIDNLRQQGYDSSAIKDALIKATSGQDSQPSSFQSAPSQTNMPQSFTQDDAGPQRSLSSVKSPQMSQSSSQGGLSEQALDTIQQVLEQIIEEKWQSASSDMSSLRNNLKSNDSNVGILEDKIDKLNQRIDSMQSVMMGKTEEYNKALLDVNVELQAFEKVIDRLVPTISDSIKELRDLIDDMKKTKA